LGRAASESSFKRVLERSALSEKRKRGLATQSGRVCSGKKAQAANEIWTVDFKGWWWNGRQRCEPLTVRLFVSSSLVGWSVGLKLTLDHQIEVWFARLPLG